MSDSLRDQLLKAGLVTERQAKQATLQSRHEQHQQTRAPKKQRIAQAQAPHAPTAAQQQAAAAKAARDQELNRRQQEKIAARARAAEITQILEQNSIARDAAGEDYFNFINNGKVRRMAVTPAERERIVRGTVVIVRWSGKVHLVPPEAAERIRERHPTAVIDLPAPSAAAADENDPYKDFVVPDDLTW